MFREVPFLTERVSRYVQAIQARALMNKDAGFDADFLCARLIAKQVGLLGRKQLAIDRKNRRALVFDTELHCAGELFEKLLILHA